MTTVHTLASGSSGNAAVLSCGDTHLLIDAGISCRRITVALKELGLTPADLTAILITHTHSDHISGLNTLLKKTACPLLATPRTCRELSCRVDGIDPRLMGLDGPITLGEIDMQPIPTSHDAPGSCGWVGIAAGEDSGIPGGAAGKRMYGGQENTSLLKNVRRGTGRSRPTHSLTDVKFS